MHEPYFSWRSLPQRHARKAPGRLGSSRRLSPGASGSSRCSAVVLSTTPVSGDARTGHAGALSGTVPAAAWLASALAVSFNDWTWVRNDDDSPPVGHPARLPPASPPASPPVGMPEARDLHPAHPRSRPSALACRLRARTRRGRPGRAGSRRGIRTRRRLQAGMDASERMGPGAPRRGHA